jgi:uncharacterized protein YxjI
MSAVLDQNLFFVREHVGVFKAANNYDILDPETGEEIIHCREPKLGWITKVLRFTDFKRNTPFSLELRSVDGVPILRVKRGVSLFLSKVKVYDSQGYVGCFEQKLFSLGGAFRVLDAEGSEVCMLQGKWTGWNFKFMFGDRELAVVSKKWSGLGRELFTSADNYVLSIDETVPRGSHGRKLILAAVLCIDMVLKE